MELKPGIYRHFKGKEYVLLGIGKDTETLEELAYYHAIDEEQVWIRSKKMFTEYLEDKGVYRFEFIRED